MVLHDFEVPRGAPHDTKMVLKCAQKWIQKCLWEAAGGLLGLRAPFECLCALCGAFRGPIWGPCWAHFGPHFGLLGSLRTSAGKKSNFGYPSGAQHSQKTRKTRGFCMVLRFPEEPYMTPKWLQNGSQNGSKSGPKHDLKNDLKKDTQKGPF